ncbi:MAG: hypothetical protein K0S33_3658 [Bacteroidetes bacterium]|jgi:hypothetical protein|nr:hypothetical protein [Bacteroidota bacterium]
MRTKKQIILYAGIGILFTLLLVAACKNQVNLVQAPKPVINPAFKGIDVPYTEYTVLAAVNDTITSASGTKIIIPAGAITDSAGNPVTEPCVLSYREFMDPASIMVSGIPMGFKDAEANLDKSFTSAGMFELKGKTKTGKDIFVSNKNPITVNLASNNSKQGYSNFFLNPNTGQWVYSGEEKIIQNLDKISLNKQIKKLKQTLAFAGKNYFVMSTSTMLDIYFKDDYRKIYSYYNRKKAKLPKRLLQYGIISSELYCWNNAFLNKQEEAASYLVWENINGKAFPKWTREKSARIEHLNGNVHMLKVFTEGKDTFQTKIRSVMRIKHLFAYDPEYWTSSYDEAMKQIQEDEARMAAMADVYRTLEVNKFGTYNCDRFYTVEEAFVIKADFQLPAGNETFKPEKVFYVSTRDKCLITYAYQDLQEITLCKDPSAVLLTVLKDNMLAEVPAKDLMAISGDKNSKQQRQIVFKEKVKIKTQEDIQKYFKNL